jgi:hypothetical protein
MYRLIGIKFLTALIISLFAVPVMASDSLMDVREYMNKVCDILPIDSNGTKNLDTATLKEFTIDGAMKAYSDLGDPKAKKFVVTKDVPGILVDAGLMRITLAMLDTNGNYQVLKRIEPSRLSDASYYNTLKGVANRPKFYIRHGDSINIVPAPAKGDTLKVFYYARGPFPYEARPDTVSIIMPSEYRWAVVYATAALCEIRRGNFDEAAGFEKLYQQEIMRLRTRFELEGLVE